MVTPFNTIAVHLINMPVKQKRGYPKITPFKERKTPH